MGALASGGRRLLPLRANEELVLRENAGMCSSRQR
jgi:hypothetical protein